MNKTRVQQVRIDVDAETKRRIELVAAEKNVSVSDYLLAAARHQLVVDGVLEPDQADSAQYSLYDPNLPRDLDELHATILARRNGEPIDIDAIIESIRNERDEQFLGLR